MLIPSIRITLILATIGLITFASLSGLFYEAIKLLAPGQFKNIRLIITGAAMLAALPPAMERSARTILSPIILATLIGPFAFAAYASGAHLDSEQYFHAIQSSAILGAQLTLVVVPIAVAYSTCVSAIYDGLVNLVPRQQHIVVPSFAASLLVLVFLLPLLNVWDTLSVRWPFRPAFDAGYVMEPSVWKGETRFAGRSRLFELAIEGRPEAGTLIGYLDWGPDLRLAVRGESSGNFLELVDIDYLIGDDDTPLGNVKTVWIEGDRMIGTDNSGLATLRARRLPDPPPPPSPNTALGRAQIAKELGARFWADIKSCNNHFQLRHKQTCYRRLAIRTGEPYFCKTVGNADARRDCRAAVERSQHQASLKGR